MAEDGRISVESKQIVLNVHEKLRKEIREIAVRKSWSEEQKKKFEEKLCELYHHSVEDSIKENVTVGGQEWDNISPQFEVTSNSVIQEEMEPINQDRTAQVFAICSELEDLLKDTTFKRKKYPQQITERIQIILESRKAMLENYQLLSKSESPLTSLHVLMPEFEEYMQRFKTACRKIPQLSKSFQDFQEKVLRLQQAIQCHNVLQKSETDAILFGRDNNDIDINTPQKIETNTSESNSENITWFEGPQKKSQPEQIHISTQSSYCT